MGIVIEERLKEATEAMHGLREILHTLAGIDQIFIMNRMLEHMEDDLNQLLQKHQDREGDEVLCEEQPR